MTTKPPSTTEYRTLRRDEIELIWTIDRRELIERIYRLADGTLRLEPHNVDVPGWQPDKVRASTPGLYECFDRGAVFFGAFEGGRLVGNAVLDTLWLGPRRDLLQLKRLHVSRDYRARGVGAHLFQQAREAAHARGARGLYISSAPTENTVRFYQRRGSILMETPDPELFAFEPEDIHLECPANGR
jgi:predicted N-acetyltransferase YhbS